MNGNVDVSSHRNAVEFADGVYCIGVLDQTLRTFDIIAHIMRPFKHHMMDALMLIEPLKLKQIAPTQGPILRERPRRYVTHYRELSSSSLLTEKHKVN